MKLRPEIGCPAEARDAAAARVGNLMSWGQLKLGQGSFTLSMPHAVFFLRATRLAHGGRLRAIAEPGGWRFLVRRGGDLVAAVQAWEADGRWKVSMVKSGSWATKTRPALEAAEAALAAKATPTFLWCRSAWTAALWLQADEASHDLVVPLPYVRHPLKPLVPLPAAQFLSEILAMVAPDPGLGALGVPPT